MRPGEEWGSGTDDPPDLEVTGTDALLAKAVGAAPPGALIRFRPAAGGSDLARAVGLDSGAQPEEGGRIALPLDGLRLHPPAPGNTELAVNGIVIGVPPDRLRAWHRPAEIDLTIDGQPVQATATTVAIMIGQYLRGADLSPRGHPGDGVAELQLYNLRPVQRKAMRARLALGTHLPHPDITVRRARRVSIRLSRPADLEVDGRAAGTTTALEVVVVPGAYRLLV